MKHILKALVASVILASSTTYAERVTVYTAPNYVQHYYEFSSENPNTHWWCGQAALKIVTKFRTGNQVSLQAIHSALLSHNVTGLYYANNCPGNWCAYIEDLVAVGKKTLGLHNASIATVPNSGYTNPTMSHKVALFNAIKNPIKAGKIIIAFGDLSTNANNLSGTGHAWVVMGYNTDGVSNPNVDPSNVWIFLRDNNLATPAYPEMDRWVTIDTFYKMMAKNTANPLKIASF